MRLAIINHLGDVGAGAEHSLLQFLVRLPDSVEPIFFFFEDGAFAESMRERFRNVTIVAMSKRIARAKRDQLSITAIPDGLALMWELAKALRSAAPDLVLTNSMKAHIVGSVASKINSIPCVNFVHDFATGPALALLRLTSRICAAERLTCSRAIARSLGIPGSTPIYAPIEAATYRDLPERGMARAKLGLPVDDRPVVALVGRIARWKGQDRFVRIALDVIHGTDAHFAIVGSPIFGCDPDFLPELKAKVASAELNDRIHFVPWQDDMRTVYGAIDLACNCSLREPFGRTSLEALASGIPVVCFDDAGVCEIFEGRQGATAVPADDEAAFADTIRKYLRNSQFLATEKTAAFALAEPFDIANIYRVFAAVIARASRIESLSVPSGDTLRVA